MKYCSKCGHELDHEAIFCSKCGCKVEVLPNNEQSAATKFCIYCGAKISQETFKCPECGLKTEDYMQRSGAGLQSAAIVFMFINCILVGLVSLFNIAIGASMYYALISIIPLLWAVPMTSYYIKSVENKRPVSITFKIMTLLFVSLISGILMLCDYKSNA